MTLKAAIAYLRSRNLYCLDKGSKPYTPVHGVPLPPVSHHAPQVHIAR